MSDFTNVENHENMFLIFVNKEMTFIISKDGMDKSLNDEFVKFYNFFQSFHKVLLLRVCRTLGAIPNAPKR